MATIIKDRQINFMVNSTNYEIAKQVFREKGLDISTAFNQFVQEVALTHDLPFKTEVERRKIKINQVKLDLFLYTKMICMEMRT